MYEHIIQAHSFVDITSLGSPNSFGWSESLGLVPPYSPNGGTETKQFGAMFRNAIAYLHSTRRAVTIKFVFGSIPNTNEDSKRILDELTRDMDLTGTKLNIWVGTYRSTASWNHGKIIAVDGKKVLTGGSNYYLTDHLQVDPVFDVNIMVSNGPAVGAHKYTAR